MIKMLRLLLSLCLLLVTCLPVSALATIDFLGAQLELKSVPTSAWKYGVRGDKLIVLIVRDKSQAKQIGFQLGDVVLTVDGNTVNTYSDLLKMSPGSHIVKVLRLNTQLELPVIIQNPAIIKNEVVINSEQNKPPIIVNDDLLEKKFGKSEPNTKSKNRTYQDCIDDEMANPNTYEYYLNNPNSGYKVTGNSRYGDGRALNYDRAKKKCEQEFKNVIHIITR